MNVCVNCRWAISADNRCGCWPLARPTPTTDGVGNPDAIASHCLECDCPLDDDEDDFCDECFEKMADELP